MTRPFQPEDPAFPRPMYVVSQNCDYGSGVDYGAAGMSIRTALAKDFACAMLQGVALSIRDDGVDEAFCVSVVETAVKLAELLCSRIASKGSNL